MEQGNATHYIADLQDNYFPHTLFDDNYIRWSPTGNWKVPDTGFKFHITCQEADADQVAKTVTWLFRMTKVFHKILPNSVEFRRVFSGPQRGKFIVAYLPYQDAQVFRLIDEFMRTDGIAEGPAPHIRNSDNSQGPVEEKVGINVYRRYYHPAHK